MNIFIYLNPWRYPLHIVKHMKKWHEVIIHLEEITQQKVAGGLLLQSGRCVWSEWISQHFSPTKQWSSWSYCYTSLGCLQSGEWLVWGTPAHHPMVEIHASTNLQFLFFLDSEVTIQELLYHFYTKRLNQFKISFVIILSLKL